MLSVESPIKKCLKKKNQEREMVSNTKRKLPILFLFLFEERGTERQEAESGRCGRFDVGESLTKTRAPFFSPSSPSALKRSKQKKQQKIRKSTLEKTTPLFSLNVRSVHFSSPRGSIQPARTGCPPWPMPGKKAGWPPPPPKPPPPPPPPPARCCGWAPCCCCPGCCWP